MPKKTMTRLGSSHMLMMAACCAAMIGAFYLFSGESGGGISSAVVPLAGCLLMHVVMMKMMGKSCHSEHDKEQPVEELAPPLRFVTGAVFVTDNSGENWQSFEGKSYMTPQRVTQGKSLYQENCTACHGVGGIGEKPGNSAATDENGMFPAPALNDNDHAWHHSDEQLIQTILEGSPRNERMLAWKEHDVTREDAQSLVAYLKSLWSFRSLACQGSRHMSCMH